MDKAIPQTQPLLRRREKFLVSLAIVIVTFAGGLEDPPRVEGSPGVELRSEVNDGPTQAKLFPSRPLDNEIKFRDRIVHAGW